MFSRVVVQNLLWYFLMNIQYSWCPKNVVVMQYNRVPSVLVKGCYVTYPRAKIPLCIKFLTQDALLRLNA